MKKIIVYLSVCFTHNNTGCIVEKISNDYMDLVASKIGKNLKSIKDIYMKHGVVVISATEDTVT